MENKNCISCDSCSNCRSCKSCSSCWSCSNCWSCSSCLSCDFCEFCNYCNYCKNLIMTEYNYFCWSKEYNSEASFQQPRYRIFNVEVGEEEYLKIKKTNYPLKIDDNDNYNVRFAKAFKRMWNELTQEEQQEYLDIPHFSWEGFTYITGITPDLKK